MRHFTTQQDQPAVVRSHRLQLCITRDVARPYYTPRIRTLSCRLSHHADKHVSIVTRLL